MVQGGLEVTYLVPKGESPELRIILVSFNADFSCTIVIFEISITFLG